MKTLLTNIISLASIFIYFLINNYGGFFMNKYWDCLPAFESENDEKIIKIIITKKKVIKVTLKI